MGLDPDAVAPQSVDEEEVSDEDDDVLDDAVDDAELEVDELAAVSAARAAMPPASPRNAA